MEDLYIQIKDGKTINHPALGNNLKEAFFEIPSDWEPFYRPDPPVIKPYEVLMSDQPLYQKVNDVWTDVWEIRDMTLEEKLAKQQAVKSLWANQRQPENWTTWIFNEETCSFIPPIPTIPVDTTKIENFIHTFWCGADNNWKDTPPWPNHDKSYQFDYLNWDWVEIT